MKKSGRNLQKKASRDCSHYSRVKSDAKKRQQRLLRRYFKKCSCDTDYCEIHGSTP